MFDALCTYPIPSDLFAQAIHPNDPLIALGLASGKVQLHRLPPPDLPSKVSKKNESTINTIATEWYTHRHKGSCRSLCFSNDGQYLTSAGTDGIVKVAATETGKVGGKIAVPLLHNGKLDHPNLLHPLTPQTLILATDSSALYLYDLRSDSSTASTGKPAQTHHPHADYVTSITSLPSTSTVNGTSASPTQWLSTGGTTVAITDIRRGILVQSEDQGEELLSSTLSGSKVVVGGEKGVLRMWEVGVWDDNETTVDVAPRGGASAEVLTSLPGNDECVVAVGMDDGNVRFVDLGGRRGKVVEGEEVRHDEVDGVLGLGFLVGGRMVSGGGAVVKIWEGRREAVGGDDEDMADDDGEVGALIHRKRDGRNNDEEEEDDDDEKESEDEEPRRKRKKRKRGKGKVVGNGRNVLKFKGLD